MDQLIPSLDSRVGDFLSEGGRARTVSAVDAEAVGGAELLLLQRLASASRAALAVQSVRAVHWSWHRQRESPVSAVDERPEVGPVGPLGYDRRATWVRRVPLGFRPP